MYKYGVVAVVLSVLLVVLLSGCGGSGGIGSLGMGAFTPAEEDMTVSARQAVNANAATTGDAIWVADEVTGEDAQDNISDMVLPWEAMDAIDEAIGTEMDAAAKQGKSSSASASALWLTKTAANLKSVKAPKGPVDFTLDGIHWVGTVSASGTEENGTIAVNLTGTGTNTNLTVAFSGTQSASGGSISLRVNGTLGWVGMDETVYRDTINASASATGNDTAGNAQITDTGFTEMKDGSSWILVDKWGFVVSGSVTFGTTDTVQLSFEDTWSMFFGEGSEKEGLFWHNVKGNATVKITDATGALVSIVLSQSMVASDGYTATFAIAVDGTVTGSMNDEKGVKVADFSGNVLDGDAIIDWVDEDVVDTPIWGWF